MDNLQLSVVIIGRNEGKRLVDCILSVKAMDFPVDVVELIYVDSNSTDGSPERAKELGVKVIVVHPERPSAAIGRNAGWKAAKAPLIMFLDGDTILRPDFIKKAIHHFRDDQVAIVWGHRRESQPELSRYQRVIDLDWIYPCGIAELCGGDAMIRRHVLEEVGGYNPILIAGEEPEMCQRIRLRGYIILHIDERMTLHDLAIHSWHQYWRRCQRTGHAFAEVSSITRNTATQLWQRESHQNLLQVATIFCLFALGLFLILALRSVWPLLISMIIYSVICLRSSIKSRWKSDNWLTLLMYGVHLQFRKIPIAYGQLSYYYCHWRGRNSHLMEYK